MENNKMTDERAAELLAAHNEWWGRFSGPQRRNRDVSQALAHAVDQLRSQPPAEAQAQGGGRVCIEAHWLENVSAAASLLEASGDVFNVREAAALRKLIASAERTAPPSAPVGVEGVEAALQKWLDWCNEHNEEPEARSGARIAIEALAQQPADTHHCRNCEGIAPETCAIRQPAADPGACPACNRAWSEHRIGYSASACKMRQPAAVDDTRRLEYLIDNELLVRRLSDTGLWMVTTGDLTPAIDGSEYDTWREAIDDALAAQQGGES